MNIFCAALLIFFSTLAHSCERPLHIQVGAFFDAGSITSIWGDFAESISKKLKCNVEIVSSTTFEDHLIKLTHNDGDFFVVPTHYVYIMSKYNLRPILKSVIPTKTYLITTPDFNPNDLASLKGESIIISSPYSSTYLKLRSQLEEQGLTDQVKFRFGYSYQSGAMAVLRGTATAAVVFSPVFDQLPNNIKSKVNKLIIEESEFTAYIMTPNQTSKPIIKAAQQSHDKLNLLKWDLADTPPKKRKLDEQFEEQLKLLLAKPHR